MRLLCALSLAGIPTCLRLAGQILATWHAGSTRHEWLNSSENETLLAGQPALQQFLYGLSFKVSPASFMQTNPAQAEVLYGLVRRAAGKLACQHVCGLKGLNHEDFEL